MINLAGKSTKNTDDQIRYELERARIDVIALDRSWHEVSATLGGRLCAWEFGRAWYYWIAQAPLGKGIPIELARELYADPVGRKDIRCGGHCGCPSPDDYGVQYFDATGNLLLPSRELKIFEDFIARGSLEASVLNGKAFTADPKRAHHYATVDCYHIDSEVGLRIFADALRGRGSIITAAKPGASSG